MIAGLLHFLLLHRIVIPAYFSPSRFWKEHLLNNFFRKGQAKGEDKLKEYHGIEHLLLKNVLL